SLSGHAKAVCHVSFSSDGKTMVTAGDDRRLIFWRVGSWRNTGELVVADDVKATAFAESPSGATTFLMVTFNAEGDSVSQLPIEDPLEWSWLRHER
ncbi:MAG: hypothetical protein KDB27_33270, partial [Planctomycetales bacterium]|nr:hypothetical protein [Planctomycetales bacterium]